MNNALKTNGANVSRPQPVASPVYYTPRVDILESDDELTLYADMPGVKAEDVAVSLDNGELTLHGRYAARAQAGTLLLAEYGVGDFYRVFTVGEGVDAAKITAELKHGVLTVHLPRNEAVKPKKIAVKGE
jgi:HSP20 family molecular chaperone IbpA